MLRHLPNFFTCCNLLCGTVGILYLFKWPGNYPLAIFIWISCFFDFLDGLVARALKVNSPIGKELDSLADVVSFGLLPSLFIFELIENGSQNPYLPFCGLLIVAGSAIRLAVFNIDESQTDAFKGLPTPANALFLTGLPFLDELGFHFILHPLSLCIVSIIFSLLLVSRIELFALKFKVFAWRSNKIRFTFLICSVLLLVSIKFAAIPLIIILYILLSLGVWVASGTRVQ